MSQQVPKLNKSPPKKENRRNHIFFYFWTPPLVHLKTLDSLTSSKHSWVIPTHPRSIWLIYPLADIHLTLTWPGPELDNWSNSRKYYRGILKVNSSESKIMILHTVCMNFSIQHLMVHIYRLHACCRMCSGVQEACALLPSMYWTCSPPCVACRQDVDNQMYF